MLVRRHYLSPALLLIVGAAAIIAASALVFAQDRSHMDHARHVHGGEATVPTMPGQEAFGTIQEIVRILDADPTTDWSKVSIGALREHLIDMDDVTMRARPTANTQRSVGFFPAVFFDRFACRTHKSERILSVLEEFVCLHLTMLVVIYHCCGPLLSH